MKHAAEDSKWEQILQMAKDGQQEPTRAQVCLTRLALFKTGRMGDELFAYPEGSAAYEAPQNQWLRLMIGPLLYYHYGKTGFASCTELAVNAVRSGLTIPGIGAEP